MTVRLTIAPGDHHDIELVPFDQLTVEQHIRIFETVKDETKADYLQRAFGVPERFARVMRPHEIDRVSEFFEGWIRDNDGRLKALANVHDTMRDFAEAHGRGWTLEEAKSILQAQGLYRERIEVAGRTFVAPQRIDVETQAGQWADLEDALNVDDGLPIEQRATESETYVKTLAILMREEVDGKLAFGYPAQGKEESDQEFSERLTAWVLDRRSMFMRATWVDVMGCAAFFFSKSDYCALYTSHRWTLFRGLIRPQMQQAPKGTRSAMEAISSFAKQQTTS